MGLKRRFGQEMRGEKNVKSGGDPGRSTPPLLS